jgi:gamma-glutamylcyclotransferase (GGCT)/AIG2-like uncharacterized protein YtfP
MLERCPNSKFSGTGFLTGYILAFRGARNRAHADIVKDLCVLSVKSVVPCAIYEISSSDEANLDRYEGYPKYYKKATVSVTRSDNAAVVQCMAYVMNGNPPLGYPTAQYFGTILQGYYDNRISPEILMRASAETFRLIKTMKG